MMIVKVIELGGVAKEYEVSQNPTVSSLVDIMEDTDPDGRVFEGTFTRNGNVLTCESSLNDGDRLFYGEKMKGNQFTVKVIRIGAAIKEFGVEHGATIRQVLNMLPDEDKSEIIKADGTTDYELRIGTGQPQSLDDVITEPSGGEARLIATKRVKGNE